jgi:hypothetical protein
VFWKPRFSAANNYNMNYKKERPFYKYRYDDKFRMYVEEISDNFEYRSYARNYDYRYGIALETEDVNGYVIKKEIDEFGRLTKVQGPKEAAAGQPYTIMMEYFPTTIVSNGNISRTAYARTKHFDAQHPNDPIETVTFADGLGRAIQVKKDGAITDNKTPDQQSDVMIVSGRAKFDAFGRVKAAYYPQTAPLGDWNKLMDSFDSVEPTKTTYDILDRPVTTTPSSLDKGGRSGEWFDFKGTLDVIIALLANELRGLKLGGGALDDKIGDGINAIDNASNAIKTIKGAGEEEKIDMQIKVYTTTDILRDNDSQVHEGKPRDTSVIASDSVKINALNKRNYNIKKQEAERKNIIYKQNK